MAVTVTEQAVRIPADGVALEGALAIPLNARGLVLFAHGAGSGRLSPRNTFVASTLQERGLATLLFDLLTPREDERYETRFNIPLLTERLLAATRWVASDARVRDLPIGFFGASTGAAAAIQAAAALGPDVDAVVSRGGRPDLAGADALSDVHAATLLIVGGADEGVIELNEDAYARLRAPEKELSIVPNATHLFEEPGALEEVAREAADWFERHLRQ